MSKNGGKQTGKRLQLILIQVKRNKDSAITELLRLPEYLRRRQNENYEVLGSVYGSPKNSLVKLCELYIKRDYIEHPLKTCYEINKLFIDSGKVRSIDVADMGVLRDVEKLGEVLLKVTGLGKKKEKYKEEAK